MKRYSMYSFTSTHKRSEIRDVPDKQGKWVRYDDIPKWINVKDRMPESDEDVLIAIAKFGGRNGHPFRVGYGFWNLENESWTEVSSEAGIIDDCESNPDYFEVTHWMLPKPPTNLE